MEKLWCFGAFKAASIRNSNKYAVFSRQGKALRKRKRWLNVEAAFNFKNDVIIAIRHLEHHGNDTVPDEVIRNYFISSYSPHRHFHPQWAISRKSEQYCDFSQIPIQNCASQWVWFTLLRLHCIFLHLSAHFSNFFLEEMSFFSDFGVHALLNH